MRQIILKERINEKVAAKRLSQRISKQEERKKGFSVLRARGGGTYPIPVEAVGD